MENSEAEARRSGEGIGREAERDDCGTIENGRGRWAPNNEEEGHDAETAGKVEVTSGGRHDGRSLETRGETPRFIRGRLVSFVFGLIANTTSGGTSAAARTGEWGGVGRLVLNLMPVDDASLLVVPTLVLEVEAKDDAVDGGVSG